MLRHACAAGIRSLRKCGFVTEDATPAVAIKQKSQEGIQKYGNHEQEQNVASSNEDNVIAPGTSKTTTFAFGYTPKADTANALTAGAIAAPEVAYTFAVDVDITGDYDALDANENFYWTLQDGEEEAVEYQTVAELLAALKALSGDASGSKVYQPGELPEAFTAADEVYTIGWAWDFSADADGDAADTLMGNAQDLDDVTFSITVSATQVD